MENRITGIQDKLKENIINIFLYAFASLCAPTVVYGVMFIVRGMMFAWNVPVSICALIWNAAITLFPAMIMIFFVKLSAKSQHEFNRTKNEVNILFLTCALPGEIIRMLVGIMPFYSDRWIPCNYGQAFSPVINLIFSGTYGHVVGRAGQLTQDMSAFMETPLPFYWNLKDALVYLAFHVVCVVPYILLLMYVYRRTWEKIEIRYENAEVRDEENELEKAAEIKTKNRREKEYSDYENQIKRIEKEFTMQNCFYIMLAVIIIGFSSTVIVIPIGESLLPLIIKMKGPILEMSFFEEMAVSFILGFGSLAFTVIAMFMWLNHIGSSVADFDIKIKKTTKMNVSCMLISVGLPVLGHMIVCLVTGIIAMSAMIWTGSVQYIVRFISQTPRSFFEQDNFAFPLWSIILGIGIYTVCIMAACFSGYIYGYRKRKSLLNYLEVIN